MRKFLLIILAAAMTFVSACGSSAEDDRAAPTPTSTNKTQSTNETKASDNTSSSAVDTREPEQSTEKEENALSIDITVNGRTFSAALYDNETARAFKDRLPLTVDMDELNGNEKYYYLPDSLPTNSSRPEMINTGDIMLYGNNCLVIFYDSFSTSYSYTPIGKIDDPDGLASVLGTGNVQVSFKGSV